MFGSNVQPRKRPLRRARDWFCVACRLPNPAWAACCTGCRTKRPEHE